MSVGKSALISPSATETAHARRKPSAKRRQKWWKPKPAGAGSWRSNRVRVVYDADAFDRQKVGGISRYLTELILTLRTLGLARPTTSFFLTDNRHLLDAHAFSVLPVPSGMKWRYKDYYKRRINDITTRFALTHNLADVFHMTYYDASLLPLLRCPLVVSVYDMIPELLPHCFSDPASIHPNKKAICDRADAVICISQNTKADLIRLFGVDPNKVFVTHLGISRDWSECARTVPNLPDRYLLFVGSRAAYKNFRQVADALADLSTRFPDLHLVCVGGGRLSEAERAYLCDRSVLDRVHQYDLSDRELAYCYSKAAAFVFPSLYEGFGIPILESFASHCPAILSDRSCFPEIAADAAEYFEPGADDSLNASIERVLGDDAYRDALVRRGEQRVSDFTWRATAIETARIYGTLA